MERFFFDPSRMGLKTNHMAQPQQRNSNKIVKGLGLLLFLVVLPGGSWYYLQKGLDYQKDLRAELTSYGDIPAFQLMDTAGKLRDSSIFSGKIAVVGFVTPEVLEQPKQMELLAKLYDQYDKKDMSRMVIFGLNWPETLHSIYPSTINPTRKAACAPPKPRLCFRLLLLLNYSIHLWDSNKEKRHWRTVHLTAKPLPFRLFANQLPRPRYSGLQTKPSKPSRSRMDCCTRGTNRRVGPGLTQVPLPPF